METPTLTQEGCLQRRRNLWQHIPEEYDWLLIGDSRHVQYFSNFRVNPVSFSADQRCLLLLQRDGSATLLADNFTRRTAACSPFVNNEVIVPWYTHRQSVINRDHALLVALEQCQSQWTTGRGVIEPEGVTALVTQRTVEYAYSVFADESGEETTLGTVVRRLRRCKLDDELALLRRCMTACDAGHRAAFEAAQPGVSELEVYLAIQQAAEKSAGCACVVYGDFRATNRDQHKAGGLPTDYVLREGDLFIVDYSVILHGYRSDFTNTIAVGKPADDQIGQFETCRDALEAAAAVLKSGVAARDVYEAASSVFTQNGFPPLAHHCGHGLGMEHPEPPILVPESTDELIAGDVVTIEPGLYVEGVGGMRFEHNYVITETGAERLSNHRIGLT